MSNSMSDPKSRTWRGFENCILGRALPGKLLSFELKLVMSWCVDFFYEGLHIKSTVKFGEVPILRRTTFSLLSGRSWYARSAGFAPADRLRTSCEPSWKIQRIMILPISIRDLGLSPRPWPSWSMPIDDLWQSLDSSSEISQRHVWNQIELLGSVWSTVQNMQWG
jgi:hypothetical protein